MSVDGGLCVMLGVAHLLMLIFFAVNEVKKKLRRGTCTGDLIVDVLSWVLKMVVGFAFIYVGSIILAASLPFDIGVMVYAIILTVLEFLLYFTQR